MKGVKFLSLNRELRETCLLPHKLEAVDAVLRDLVSSSPHNDAPIAAEKILATTSNLTDDEPHALEETEAPWTVAARGTVKTPFLASIQYDCLDGCADAICNLIEQFESSKLSSLATNFSSSNEDMEMTYDDNQTSLQQASETNGFDQCQKLEGLCEWRRQLMARLNSYDISGTVLQPECTKEI